MVFIKCWGKHDSDVLFRSRAEQSTVKQPEHYTNRRSCVRETRQAIRAISSALWLRPSVSSTWLKSRQCTNNNLLTACLVSLPKVTVSRPGITCNKGLDLSVSFIIANQKPVVFSGSTPTTEVYFGRGCPQE